MNWGIEDVFAAAALLGGAVLAILLIRRTVVGRAWRAASIGAVVLLALAVWAHLAVGVF